MERLGQRRQRLGAVSRAWVWLGVVPRDDSSHLVRMVGKEKAGADLLGSVPSALCRMILELMYEGCQLWDVMGGWGGWGLSRRCGGRGED